MNKIASACLAVIALTACDQNVSATLYVRDIQEVSASASLMAVPVDLSIEILESGLVQKCARPEGQELVDAVAAVFEKAALIGCEKVSGSLNDRMTIKATTTLYKTKQGQNTSISNLLAFEAGTAEDGSSFVNVRFNPEKYEEVQRRLRRVNSMASIKLSDAFLSLGANNDLREPVTAIYSRGVFINSQPIDLPMQQQLNPRQEAIIKLGDVKLASLAQNGSALVFGIDKQTNQSTSN